jgi:hypothetical protein
MNGQPVLNLVQLNGTPRQRGQIHGEALRIKVRDNIGGWKDQLGKSVGENPDAYLAEFLANTDFQPAIQSWTPQLWEEVQGLAEGAGVPIDTIYAFQLPDEEWLYRRNRRMRLRAGDGEHCSSLGVLKNNGGLPSFIAQNMDVPNYYDGYQTVLYIKHLQSQLEELVFVAAGQIALNGLNNQGVGVCVNTLMQLNSSVHGLPVAFVIRGALAQDSFAMAAAFLQAVPHASGQNYMLGSTQEILDFECSAGKIAKFSPGGANLYHTNHPIVNDDQLFYTQLLGMLSPEDTQSAILARENTLARFAWLEKHTQAAGAEMNITDVKRILSNTLDAPVCVERRHPFSITLGCTIMEFSLPPVLHISPGPPSQTDFFTLSFSNDRI